MNSQQIHTLLCYVVVRTVRSEWKLNPWTSFLKSFPVSHLIEISLSILYLFHAYGKAERRTKRFSQALRWVENAPDMDSHWTLCWSNVIQYTLSYPTWRKYDPIHIQICSIHACWSQFCIHLEMAVFWVVAPCSMVEVYQRFRGPCDDRPDDGGSKDLWNVGILLPYYTALTQKTAIFVLTAVRTSNPTCIHFLYPNCDTPSRFSPFHWLVDQLMRWADS
jgi:hypothetical protein